MFHLWPLEPSERSLERRSFHLASPTSLESGKSFIAARRQQERTERRKRVNTSSRLALEPSSGQLNAAANKWQLYLLVLSAGGALLGAAALTNHQTAANSSPAPVAGELKRLGADQHHRPGPERQAARAALPVDTRRVKTLKQQEHHRQPEEDIDELWAASKFDSQRRKPALDSPTPSELTERQFSSTSSQLSVPTRNQSRTNHGQNKPYVGGQPAPDSAPDLALASNSRWIPLVEPSRAHPRPPGQRFDSARLSQRVRQHQRAASYQPNHWRKPRQHRISPSKMYKRVLLCDKTLVSLDYVRNLELEPRPWGSFDELDEFDDQNNVIELDLSPDADRRAHNSSAGARQPDRPQARAAYTYLTDSDPLVRCDMWDLEKGSKNRKPPKDILRSAVRADFDTVRDAINRCRQLSEKTLSPDDELRDGLDVMSADDLVSLFSIKRGLIPGTKWCGLGDQAHSYNDLGSKQRIDLCCRAHDHCPIRSKPFRNDYGVLNLALYTKSHCDCDADFYACLRDVRSRTADMLGNLYFNVMKLQCLREERMKICRQMR